MASTKYTIAANSNPDVPLPLGTRGGIGFKHNFPADGEYRITINDLGVGIYTSTLENQSTLVIMIDGKIVFRQTIGGPEDWQLHRKGPKGRAQIMERFTKIPVQVEAGVHDVVVAFIDRSHVESPHNIADPFFDELTKSCSCAPPGRRNKLVDGVVISGPFNPTGVSEHSQPRSHLCLRPECKGRVRVRPSDHGKPRASRVPPAGNRGRGDSPHAVL